MPWDQEGGRKRIAPPLNNITPDTRRLLKPTHLTLASYAEDPVPHLVSDGEALPLNRVISANNNLRANFAKRKKVTGPVDILFDY